MSFVFDIKPELRPSGELYILRFRGCCTTTFHSRATELDWREAQFFLGVGSYNAKSIDQITESGLMEIVSEPSETEKQKTNKELELAV
jgi:hypothetical protein